MDNLFQIFPEMLDWVRVRVQARSELCLTHSAAVLVMRIWQLDLWPCEGQSDLEVVVFISPFCTDWTMKKLNS